MEALTPAQAEEQKQHLYSKLSKRQKKYVDRIGYENWEPFQMPNDPLDIRRDDTGYTAQELALMFFRSLPEGVNDNYKSMVNEFTVTLLGAPDRVRPLMEFTKWYLELRKQIGLKF